MLKNILTGGFFAGKKTFILGWMIVLQAVVAWAVGDMTLAELITQAPEILGGLGLITLRLGVGNS